MKYIKTVNKTTYEERIFVGDVASVRIHANQHVKHPVLLQIKSVKAC